MTRERRLWQAVRRRAARIQRPAWEVFDPAGRFRLRTTYLVALDIMQDLRADGVAADLRRVPDTFLEDR